MMLTIVAQEVVVTPVMITVGGNEIPVDPPQFDTHVRWVQFFCPAPICGEQQLVEMKKKLRKVYEFSEHSPYNFFFLLYVAEVKDAIAPTLMSSYSLDDARNALERYYRKMHATKWHKTFMLHFEYCDYAAGTRSTLNDVRVLRWQYSNWEMRLYLARNAQRGYSVRNKAGLLRMLQNF